jgi:hypothetical protein
MKITLDDHTQRSIAYLQGQLNILFGEPAVQTLNKKIENLDYEHGKRLVSVLRDTRRMIMCKMENPND